MIREHDTEPVPGLPEALPPGEIILWQGTPSWRSFAVHGFHGRKVAIYFALLVIWCMSAVLSSDEPRRVVTESLLPLLALWPAGLLLVAVLAWLVERTTLYTITNRRVVLRIGIAFPMTINVPFRLIEGVALRPYGDGTGEIALSLTPGNNIAFLALWPHVRPWRVKKAEPSLRCLGQVSEVAEILAEALAGGPVAPRLAQARPEMIETLASGGDNRPPAPAAA